MAREYAVDAREAVREITLTIRVEHQTEVKIRNWLMMLFLRLAAMVAVCNVEIEQTK